MELEGKVTIIAALLCEMKEETHRNKKIKNKKRKTIQSIRRYNHTYIEERDEYKDTVVLDWN